MGRARLALLFALVGCQSGTFSPGAPAGSPGEPLPLNATSGGRAAHLYVSVSPAKNPNAFSVKRFPLVNGIPQSKPDRIYRGHGQLIAVSADGTLYAADPSFNPLTVYAFDDGHTKPDRTIEIGYPGTCVTYTSGLTQINALAADRQGNLFVGILTYPQDARHGRSAVKPASAARVPCNGVAIYAPGAKGSPEPIQSINLGRNGFVNALAVDAADNLYIGNYPTAILEYANAIKDPMQTREFQVDAPAWVSSLATGAAGDIFVSSTDYQTAMIDRYGPKVPSQGSPTSTITLAGSGFNALLSIAVRGRNLYADDKIDSVDLYRARSNGPQTPFDSLPFPYVRSVTVGP